jgi:transposase
MSKIWGRKVHDLSYYAFAQMLNYKLLRRGKYLLKIGRFEPSTQICSKCGHRQKMPLNERTYHCPECGNSIDRDVNAAINIRNFAMRKLISNTVGTTGINACGDESSSHCENHNDQTIINEARKILRKHTKNGN